MGYRRIVASGKFSSMKAEAQLDKKSPTILFVDDETLSLKYFKATVSKYANVRTATSADAAMEILEAEGDGISVVVSDERMPRASGVEFLSDVRKSWPSTIRILTSAYANIDNLQHAINQAAIYRFVPKPWNLDELCVAMQDALKAERAAVAVADPVLGPMPAGDAHDANLALLAILAGGFEAPLNSLETEAFQLTQLGGQLDNLPSKATHVLNWSSRLRSSRIAASADQVRREVERCRSLAKSIKNLARNLANPTTAPLSSMSDTLLEAIEVNAPALAQQRAFDAQQDFSYRIPREIMKFVLSNVLRRDSGRGTAARLFSEIKLCAAPTHNEVQLTVASGDDAAAHTLADDQSWRIVRSALWAFGGELQTRLDEKTGRLLLVVCVPKAA
jgi:two-component system probable response regulator PhcQ